MRFNNKKATDIIPSIYIIIAAVFITNAFATVEVKYDDSSFDYNNLILNGLALFMALYIFTVGRYFEFDSDGETLNFKSTGLLVSKFQQYREQRTEIPKTKLVGYKIENYFIYKRLHIYITSKNKRGFRHYKYHITFLGNKKYKSLKHALEKIVEFNKVRV